MSQAARTLRERLDGEGLVVAPFLYDALQARLAQSAGFEAVYMTGFGTAAARGYPDLGLLSFSEMVQNVRWIAAAVDLPVICDADTGYGNALNVMRTVREYEQAGAAALHLEDQVWPKRCGFLEGKEVIPLPQMLAKLRAACDARRDPAFVLIGRTDALQPHGWDEVERRAHAFVEAGADLVFVDGIRTLEDLDEYGRRLGDLPRLYNGALLPATEIEQRGFKLMIHIGTLGAIFSAMRGVFEELGRSGALDGAADARGFADLLELMGVSEQLELAAKYEG